jgi:hypothetical protein
LAFLVLSVSVSFSRSITWTWWIAFAYDYEFAETNNNFCGNNFIARICNTRQRRWRSSWRNLIIQGTRSFLHLQSYCCTKELLLLLL